MTVYTTDGRRIHSSQYRDLRTCQDCNLACGDAEVDEAGRCGGCAERTDNEVEET